MQAALHINMRSCKCAVVLDRSTAVHSSTQYLVLDLDSLQLAQMKSTGCYGSPTHMQRNAHVNTRRRTRFPRQKNSEWDAMRHRTHALRVCAQPLHPSTNHGLTCMTSHTAGTKTRLTTIHGNGVMQGNISEHWRVERRANISAAQPQGSNL